MKTVLTLTLQKSTKGTHVYANDTPDSAVPTLYVRKSALPLPTPQTIQLTIEVPQ